MDTQKSRREFLLMLASLPAAFVLGAQAAGPTSSTQRATAAPDGATGSPPFRLPPLPYSYDALEPFIDARTMELHHTKHHAAYVDNLNKALSQHPELAARGLESLLGDLTQVPEDIRQTVRNHGGGHWNHTFFWSLMTPGGAKVPSGKLAQALKSEFGEIDTFKKQFEQAGTKHFGSGWVWLVVTREKKLAIMTTPNQDTPLAAGAKPVLGNDVWEHAYYLKYQNRRGEYLAAWWNVLNWDIAEKNFLAALNEGSSR